MVTVDGRISMSDRASLRRAFVVRTGWGDARESLLAGDASFRKYFRLVRPSGTAVVFAGETLARLSQLPAAQHEVSSVAGAARRSSVAFQCLADPDCDLGDALTAEDFVYRTSLSRLSSNFPRGIGRD